MKGASDSEPLDIMGAEAQKGKTRKLPRRAIISLLMLVAVQAMFPSIIVIAVFRNNLFEVLYAGAAQGLILACYTSPGWRKSWKRINGLE